MCPELPPVAFHGRMHSYHWFTMTQPPCIPPTRASVGAFHAHEGDDGEEEGDEKEAVNMFCERGCRLPAVSLWKHINGQPHLPVINEKCRLGFWRRFRVVGGT